MNLTSITLYKSSDAHNQRLDCPCTKMMRSVLFDLQSQNKVSTSNTLPLINAFIRHSNPLYLCLLGAGAAGVEGFFKGIGKGLLGLLVHPTGGVIDMVSFTLDGVRRLKLLYFNSLSQK